MSGGRVALGVLAAFVVVAVFVALGLPTGSEGSSATEALGIAAAILALGLLVSFGVLRAMRAQARRLAEAEQARAVAERTNATTSRFLANMSHELRTPLNGVLGLSEVLLRRSPDERSKVQLRSIARSARTLLALVDDVLDLSRVRSGRFELERASFDPEDLGLAVCEMFAPACHARGVALVLDVEADVPTAVLGDRLRLEQVLTNLVGNAVKFTERGVVTLELRWREGALHVAVRDTGIGIPERELPRIFEAFRQAEASTARRFGGSGLGLAISRDLVRQMGGELEVSTREGEGCVFSFALPMAVDGPPFVATLGDLPPVWLTANDEVRGPLRSALERAGAQVEEVPPDTLGPRFEGLPTRGPAPLWIWDGRIDEPEGALREALARAVRERRVVLALHVPSVAELPFGELGTRVLPAPFSRELLARVLRGDALVSSDHGVSAGGVRPARILIAEDDETNRLVVSSLLEELGVRAELVVDGAEAVARVCGDDVFDVVLMDCQMPVLDGYEATRRIRRWESEQGRARIPIVAVSAHALAEERARATSAGMDGYLTKPLTLESFREALITHVGEDARSSIAPPPK